MSKELNRPPRYVLMVVATLLFASGGIRLVTGVPFATAMAEEQTKAAETHHEIAAETDEPEIGTLLAALQIREARVVEREIAMEDRMRAMGLAEEELMARLNEVKAAEDSLLAALALSESASENDIARLTAVYENMKAADAASLFEQMAPEFASGFIVRMQPQAAAAIMAGLEPQTAYSISAIIAGRNANAPTE